MGRRSQLPPGGRLANGDESRADGFRSSQRLLAGNHGITACSWESRETPYCTRAPCCTLEVD
jgi:hypothetical protein